MGTLVTRIAFAIALVLLTWNPSTWSYVDWALRDRSSFDAVKAFFGVLLLGGWVFCVRSAWVSLGAVGLVLVGALLAHDRLDARAVRRRRRPARRSRSSGSCWSRSASRWASASPGRRCGSARPGRSRPTEPRKQRRFERTGADRAARRASAAIRASSKPRRAFSTCAVCSPSSGGGAAASRAGAVELQRHAHAGHRPGERVRQVEPHAARGELRLVEHLVDAC